MYKEKETNKIPPFTQKLLSLIQHKFQTSQHQQNPCIANIKLYRNMMYQDQLLNYAAVAAAAASERFQLPVSLFIYCNIKTTTNIPSSSSHTLLILGISFSFPIGIPFPTPTSHLFPFIYLDSSSFIPFPTHSLSVLSSFISDTKQSLIYKIPIL